jgi:hypothetical protein
LTLWVFLLSNQLVNKTLYWVKRIFIEKFGFEKKNH